MRHVKTLILVGGPGSLRSDSPSQDSLLASLVPPGPLHHGRGGGRGLALETAGSSGVPGTSRQGHGVLQVSSKPAGGVLHQGQRPQPSSRDLAVGCRLDQTCK